MRAARARARRAHRVSAQACASSRLAVEEGANYRVSARTPPPRAPVRAASRPPAAAGPPGSLFSRTKATATLLLFRLQSTPEFAAWRGGRRVATRTALATAATALLLLLAAAFGGWTAACSWAPGSAAGVGARGALSAARSRAQAEAAGAASARAEAQRASAAAASASSNRIDAERRLAAAKADARAAAEAAAKALAAAKADASAARAEAAAAKVEVMAAKRRAAVGGQAGGARPPHPLKGDAPVALALLCVLAAAAVARRSLARRLGGRGGAAATATTLDPALASALADRDAQLATARACFADLQSLQERLAVDNRELAARADAAEARAEAAEAATAATAAGIISYDGADAELAAAVAEADALRARVGELEAAAAAAGGGEA